MRLRFPIRFALLVAALGFAGNARAVILYSSATQNTDPPGSLTNRGTDTGPAGTDDPRRLLNSGWQWEGQFLGAFLGTPIAPNYFITAQHIAGQVGATMSFQGSTYTTNAYWDAPNSDLRIWRTNETFSDWAPLYTTGDEVGKPLVVIGRGTQRGDEVRVGGVLKGWEWGPHDGTQSWGENVVSGVVDFSQTGDHNVLYFDFNANGGPNEAALSAYDSGGGMFIQDSSGLWRLAGINYGVDGPWRTSVDGMDISASIFDAGGLYYNFGTSNSPNWQIIPAGEVGSSYVSRISSEMTWIESIIGTPSLSPSAVPEPTCGMLILAGLGTAMLRRRAARH